MNRQTFFRGAGLAGLFLSCANTLLAQSGSVNFANDGSCKVINSQTTAPATTGTAALYWAPTNSSSFVQIGASTSLGNPAAGFFAGGTRFTPAAGGVPGQFQVRAWMGAFATYEQALAVPGALVGASVVLTVTTGNPLGDPPTPPASLVAAGLLSFTLSPSVNPPLTLTCASNKTVECSLGWDFDAPTASGGCGSITITVISNSNSGICPQLFTRIWRATDGCTTNTCSQTVTAIDTIPPIITCASNKNVACGTPWTFDPPAFSDGCSSPTLAVINTVTNALCGNTFAATRNWRAMDACGNTNTCSQTVTVLDMAAPLIVCGTNKTVVCGTPWTFDTPTASDTCGTNAILVLGTLTNTLCGNTFTATRTWRSTDACGNTAQCSQTVTGVDLTPPTLSCASNKTVTCTSVWSFDEPAASDGCSTNTSLTVLLTQTNSTSPLVVTRTWEARDACSNSAYCSQTVTVLPNCPPLLSCGSNKVVSCTDAWSFDAPTALDGCGGSNVTATIVGTITNTLCPLSLTRTWRATNDCNPAGVVCSQTVTVHCPSCPELLLTKSCPAYPVPPGGTLAWAGTITNGSEVTISNVVVLNNQPAPNTLVFGPATLAPGAGAKFAGSYSVPACSCGPHADTLTATGLGPQGMQFNASVTANCAGTNHITPGDMNGDGIVDQGELNAVLANYWAHSPWVYMTNAALLSDGRFQFELTNASAWNFTVLVSTNATDWTNLPGPAFPVYQFTDPEGTNALQRLYRLQWP